MNSERKIYSVAEVNRKARMVLEGGVGELWVEGELSRVTVHASGHWYFTLKDEAAAVSCAMFRNDNARVLFHPKDGLKVQLFARPSLYEASGRYQLIVSQMEETGKGSLQEQFEKLKSMLAEEGLFDASRKKPLPLLPRKIGVVTSPTGAAIRDIIHVLTRRFPNIQILLAPVLVQGGEASEGIAKAIDYLNTRDDIDVMIVGRGGGSIEDLWCFNEETVARAIARSVVPVVSAVGHEIDFTIADFVADVRAPTPSAAAELAVCEKGDLEEDIMTLQHRLKQGFKARSQDLRLRLNRAVHSYVFREPVQLIGRYRQSVGMLQKRLPELLMYSASTRRQRLGQFGTAITHRLQSGVQQAHQRTDELSMMLWHRIEQRLERDRQALRRMDDQLRALNPLAVLGRGYSLTRKPDGTIVRSIDNVKVGEAVVTQLADGKLISNVSEIE